MTSYTYVSAYEYNNGHMLFSGTRAHTRTCAHPHAHAHAPTPTLNSPAAKWGFRGEACFWVRQAFYC